MTHNLHQWLHKSVFGPNLVNDWSNIWKLKVFEKIKLFVWLLLHDATQVNAHWYRCHLAQSPGCARCSCSLEDNLHALRDCPHAREVWLSFNAQRWLGFFSSTVQVWVQTLIRGHYSSLFLAVLWRQWRWRNEAVLGNKRWTVAHVCDEIRKDLADYERWLGGDNGQVLVTPHVIHWTPPSNGFISLMVDGAYNPVYNRMGMGGLVRDSSGTWLGGFYAGNSGGDSLYAEMQALEMGLRFLWRKNWRKTIVGMDCLKVVKMVGKRSIDYHRYGSLLMDIHLLLARNWEIKVVHVPREGNAPADVLAGLGARLQCAVVDLVSPPDEVLTLLQEDLVAL